MAPRHEARDENDLALDDKLDLARTLLAWDKRKELRHEKNRVLAAIRQSHAKEVKDGEVRTASVQSADQIIAHFAGSAPALDSGADDSETGGDK